MVRLILGALSLALLGVLSWAVLALPTSSAGLTEASLQRLSQSGVTNPVTAVLLNYRGYDTMLELGVLLLALTAVWSLGDAHATRGDSTRPLLLSLLRLLLPLLVLAAGYLLWIGSFAPGGAFQGGALLGGAMVLALLGGLVPSFVQRSHLIRPGLVLGVIAFVTAGALTLGLNGQMLQYPAGSAGVWILAIEAAATISIGLALGMLYLGGRPKSEHGRPESDCDAGH